MGQGRDVIVMTGLEQLAGISPDRILILTRDLQRDPPTLRLVKALCGARVINWTDNRSPTQNGWESPSLLATLRALHAQPCDAVIVAQDRPKLKLLGLSKPAAHHFLWKHNQLEILSPRSVTRRLRDSIQKRRRELVWLRNTVGTPRMPAPLGPGNDYTHIEHALRQQEVAQPQVSASVIIPVYNRKEVLAKTLAGLQLQTYPRHLFEVIVADDGSSDHPEELVQDLSAVLDIRYVRQENKGFRAGAARNLGIRSAKGDVVVMLDCDMLPPPGYLHAVLRWFEVTDESIAVIGYRRFVNTDNLTPNAILEDFGRVERLTDCLAPAAVRDRVAPTQDWRLQQMRGSRRLKDHPHPFRFGASGNMALRRQLAIAAGLFDETFERWGGEDMEFSYRLYQRGAYFVYEPGATAFHQDHPPAVSRDEDRKASIQMLGHRAPLWRRYVASTTKFEVPRVSVYIPAYNAAQTIKRAVDSALAQTYEDLEVCICDDGSTDDTVDVLAHHYKKDARVRWVQHDRNRGIGCASNTAVGLCRGEFILQLDADDELLPTAAEELARVLDADSKLALAYGGVEFIDPKGRLYSRTHRLPLRFDPWAMLHGCVVSHPRMFRARDYYRTEGFSEEIENAIDYDFLLKLTERGYARAIRHVLYRYYIHGNNTSIKNRHLQYENHAKAVRSSLQRRGLDSLMTVGSTQPGDPTRAVLGYKTDMRIRVLVAHTLEALGLGRLADHWTNGSLHELPRERVSLWMTKSQHRMANLEQRITKEWRNLRHSR